MSLADFVFAKEVRLGTYSGKGPAPPAAIVAAKAIAQDPRAEPRFAERVPYIVVHGAPGFLTEPDQAVLLKDSHIIFGGIGFWGQKIPFFVKQRELKFIQNF